MANDEQELYLLHGDLDLHILEARGLPYTGILSEPLRRCFTGLQSKTTITNQPYVTVSAPQVTLARTRVLSNSQNPRWNEQFHIPLAHPLAFLDFRVKDNDVFGAVTIGNVFISAEKIASGEEISGWFPIISPHGPPPKPDRALRVQMRFVPCARNPLYRHGIAGDPLCRGVERTYFPLRKGSSVTLYQDAHNTDDDDDHGLPGIELDNGLVREKARCWEDICHAIAEARHLIYIVGWSVFHKVKLIREPSRPLPRGGDLTLGELLKYKSREGVRVLLLVWDDKTSHDKFFLKTAGVMNTHDEDTKKFFRHSSVICVLSPRYASNKLSYMKQQVVGNVFTHHQKCVLVDTQAFGENQRITAFLGGLDLRDGRYDTPKHRLFHDLETVFKDDFYQPTFPIWEERVFLQEYSTIVSHMSQRMWHSDAVTSKVPELYNAHIKISSQATKDLQI